jgi:hypothetical protein
LFLATPSAGSRHLSRPRRQGWYLRGIDPRLACDLTSLAYHRGQAVLQTEQLGAVLKLPLFGLAVSAAPYGGPLQPAKPYFQQQSRKSLKRMSPFQSTRISFGVSIKLSNTHQGIAKRNDTNQCLALPEICWVKDSSVVKKTTVVMQRLFRTKDAAHYLGMSAWALRKEVGKGELPFISSGEHTSSWKFDVGDLDAWVERHRISF